ncbi:hypothetical protein SAY87_030803 [Trapa incisa]|uniref:Uncharacterized protein n=1 Tax=Trapa incisa TaxID=236973 RepID=A0AAN7KVW2_9MYRT|nr:hypothetical protein SAY87_030803 [Trapa incisa]
MTSPKKHRYHFTRFRSLASPYFQSNTSSSLSPRSRSRFRISPSRCAFHPENLDLESEPASGSEEALIEEPNGSMPASQKAGVEDGEVLKLETEGEQVETNAVNSDDIVENGGEDGSFVENKVPKSKIPVMGVWAMLKRGFWR